MWCEVAKYSISGLFLSFLSLIILQVELQNTEVGHNNKIQFLSFVSFWRMYEEVLTSQQLKDIFVLVAICLQCFMTVQ